MRHLVAAALLVVAAAAGLGRGEVTYEEIEGGFTISFQNEVIFRHTTDNPIFYIGTGNANFTEHQGNFDIQDETLIKLPLQDFTKVSVEVDVVSLVFTTATDPDLLVELTVKQASDNRVDISAKTSTFSYYNRFWVRVWAEEAEQVWGAGEQYSYLNLRGRDYPIWPREQGVGRDGGIIANLSDVDGAEGDYHTTYYPMSSFLSSRGYSLLTQTPEYVVLDFTEAAYHEVFLHNYEFYATLLREPTLMATVQAVTIYLGTQPQLPDWIMRGAILGVQRGTAEMLFRYQEARDAGVDVSGLWIQDWSGSIQTLFGHRVYWNWRWNETYYPDLDLAITTLAQEGTRVLAYANPHLIEGSDMFEEAAAHGYLMTDSHGDAFRQDFGGFLAGTVDLLSPDAFNWYKEEIEKNMIALGFGGWMADFGEYTRYDMYSRAPYDGESRHMLFPWFWAMCNRAALDSSGTTGQVVPFMRSGSLHASGSQVLAWAGDQNVNWAYGDGLPSTVIAAHNLAISGMGVTHFDIGGYTTQPPVLVRSKELLLRSAEYAVFTPVMRTHEGNKPGSNHQYYSDQDTLQQFARLTQMHTRLLPYARHLSQNLETKGTPMQRPLFLQFEEDPGSYEADYQYMYGPDLLVAPVLHKNVDEWEVYLPGEEVKWIHLWGDGTAVTGPARVKVPAPLGYPPVFYRRGSAWESIFQEIAADFGNNRKLKIRH
ncbi:sulfoquinovosidase-like isoform X2 [Portunus trituberculatus]|nr:sulfoquinovosidase-like isoform X2 [Portunus trituberculatus]XP_045104099.1 sulfoquinovosidase-like isoform X2 [Portunus trituberculatus]